MKQTFRIAVIVALAGGSFLSRGLLAQGSRTAEVQLKAAQHKEEVEGDLKGAIEQYKKIAQGSDRATAAKALVRMGECYQKLGDAESRTVYERVVREFADQAEAAAQARTRLASLKGAPAPNAGIVTRQVWTGPNVYIYGSVSPDGRYVSFVDRETGDLGLHDLASGKDRRLTNQGTGQLTAPLSVISPDGKQVAYSWRSREGRAELRLIGLNGSGPATPQVLYDNEDIDGIVTEDWSPDGKWIAVQLRRKDLTAQIGLVSTTARVLKSVDWRLSTNVSFSPDGDYLAFDLPSSENPEQRDVFVLAADGSREIPAAVHPANDVAMGWTPDGKHLLFASNRTGAMGVWALAFRDGKPQGAPALVKPDIGPSRSLGITRSGALYFGVQPERTDIYVGSVDFNSGEVLTPPVRTTEEFVGFNVQPDWSPDGKYLAYGSLRDPVNSYITHLVVRSVDTGQTRELRPNLSQFNWPRWAPDGRSFAVQGRDSKGRQGIYRVDAQTAEVSPLMQSPPGDTSFTPQWAPDGKRIFYRRSDSARKESVIIELDLVSGKERELFRTKAGFFGLSAAPDGRYLAFRTSDPATEESIALVVPVAGGEPRELLRLRAPQALTGNFTAWTRDGRSIIFQKTPAPPLPRISATGELDREYWLVPLAGGQPRKVDVGMRSGVLRVHPDGSHVAIATGANRFEVWVMENLLPTLSAKK